MQEVYVSLKTAQRVQSFVKTLTPLEGEFEFVSGPYVLDARSLMGVLSLELSQPILLKIYHATQANMDAIAPYVVQGPEVEHEQ